jgi:nitrite reductase/ring-hydroxylating ferredoxin subunit
MSVPLTQDEKIKRGAEDSGRYFRYMTEFVGFTPQDARAIRESALVIEKHIPDIVSDFYAHLLRYPPTQKHFLRKDGTLDHDYLQKRMYHLSNFWRRTASGEYDDEYARYVDYVGRAHTSHGADPSIYIAERYVIGQVGFVQHAISSALASDLHEYDPEMEARSVAAWNKLMMVILEMLARAYRDEHEIEASGTPLFVDEEAMHILAVQTYELGLGLERPRPFKTVRVAAAAEIPEGERKIVQIDELSIGVFHHKDQWYALRNHCLHRGGPIATGAVTGEILTCPWHGYQYNLTNGQLLVDASMKLPMYMVTLQEGEIFLTVPDFTSDPLGSTAEPEKSVVAPPPTLKENEFRASDLKPGRIHRVTVGDAPVAVYNVGGTFYATSDLCTHEGGYLHDGDLESMNVVCPLHGSCFDIRSGAVTCGPADVPIRTYNVHIHEGIIQVTESI